MNTINGDDPWKYLDLVNECIRILLTVALGALFGSIKIFDAEAFLPHCVKFVFYVALPALVVRGLGIGIDFYDETFSWTYIALFLALRVIGLCLAIVSVSFRGNTHDGIGQVAVVWLSLTWISTVILGVPISTAVFGSPQYGVLYGIVSTRIYCCGSLGCNHTCVSKLSAYFTSH